MKPEFAKIIEWKQFDAPSDERPFGLILDTQDILSDDARLRMIQIAISLIGPAMRSDNMAGRWSTVYNCKTCAFDTEGARAAFVMATKGDVSAL